MTPFNVDKRTHAPNRAGQYVLQPCGYHTFVPCSLPPDPPLDLASPELLKVLSDADRCLGRLDAVATLLPNPDLFVAMYVRHEAVLSSQIEGTQSTLDDVLGHELNPAGDGDPQDVAEVVNYVAAMNHGLARLESLPLSLRLIREIHGRLLQGVRGGDRQPGEFRTTQNWIGPEGCRTPDEADFVPPSPGDMVTALNNLEAFMSNDRLPVLVQCALIHAQFETIHPFYDGNGRVGRLLITFMLCHRRVLQLPLLYLSYYFKTYRAEYYDRLMAVRNAGDWEGWVGFFLRGVRAVAEAATATARAIVSLVDSHRRQIMAHRGSTPSALQLLEYLPLQPVLSVRRAEQRLGCSYVTASKAVGNLQELGILREITGRERGRLYRYDAYLALFEHQSLAISR